MMLPSGNDAAYAIAEFIGSLLFFEDPAYRNILKDAPLKI